MISLVVQAQDLVARWPAWTSSAVHQTTLLELQVRLIARVAGFDQIMGAEAGADGAAHEEDTRGHQEGNTVLLVVGLGCWRAGVCSTLRCAFGWLGGRCGGRGRSWLSCVDRCGRGKRWGRRAGRTQFERDRLLGSLTQFHGYGIAS